MKIEDLLDPETLPDDLRGLEREFKLAPKDPVFALIAWHWHRVKAAEDSLRAATVEFRRRWMRGSMCSRVPLNRPPR